MNNKKSLPFNNPWLLIVEGVEKSGATTSAEAQAARPISAWLKPMLLPAVLQNSRKVATSTPAPATLPTGNRPTTKKTLPTPETLQQYQQLAEEATATLARVNVRTQRNGVPLISPDTSGDTVSIALRAALKRQRR